MVKRGEKHTHVTPKYTNKNILEPREGWRRGWGGAMVGIVVGGKNVEQSHFPVGAWNNYFWEFDLQLSWQMQLHRNSSKRRNHLLKVTDLWAEVQKLTGVFPIRQSLRLRNHWLQFLQRFLMVFNCILEFSESLLILRIYYRGTWNLFHNSLNCLSIHVGVYKRE